MSVSPMWQMINIAPADDLRQFLAAWGDMMVAIKSVRRKHDSDVIQNPKLPSAITEAIAARIYRMQNATEGGTIRRGSGADLVITSKEVITKIEVKGSGTAEFQTIGPKDRCCDILMWLRFGDVTKLSLESEVRWTSFKPQRCISELSVTRLSYSTLRANQAGVASEGQAKIQDIL